jgi:hypothetical protein
VAAFVLGGVLGWHIKPGADKPIAVEPVKLTVNPTAKEVKKADVAVKVVSKGQLSGTAKLSAVTTAATIQPANPAKDKPPDPGLPGEESAGKTIPTPIEVTVPVSGTITARYTRRQDWGGDRRGQSGERRGD